MADKPKKPAKPPSPKLQEKRYANLRPWKPGIAPNPGGRPKQHKEMVQRLRENSDLIMDTILALIHKGREGKLTTSDKYLIGHVWECWQAAYGRHPQNISLTAGVDVGDTPPAADGTGGALTALLRAARKESSPRENDRKPAAEAPPAEAFTAEQEITGLSILLARTRLDSPDGESASEREVLESIVGKDRAAELIGTPAPDVIVVNSAGRAAAPPAKSWRDKPLVDDPPASAADEPAAPAQSSAAEAPPEAKPPPFTPPPQPPPREPRRPSGFPEFDRFSAEKARTLQADQERAKKVEQARAEGRPQISAAEAFPPDPREPPEIVNFTLAGGGRIKRC